MKISKVGRSIPSKSLLWRYFDFQKFLSLAIEQSIFFTRMDKMEDVNEGISMNQLLEKYGSEFEKDIVKISGIDSKKKDLNLQIRQKKYFLSCWLIHHRESVAMWNSYSDDNGIALRVNASSLINAITRQANYVTDAEKISTLFYGPIIYNDFFKPEDRHKFKDEIKVIGFQKDICFDHEKEFRFLFKQDLHLHRDEDIPFLKLKLKDFSKLKFDLVFHPKMEDWKKENIRAVLKSLNIKNIKPVDSELKLKSW